MKSKSGARWTNQEIAQQPDVWLKVEKTLANDAGATRAFLEPLLARNEVRIVLAGAGTSACIGECLAPTLTRRFGMRVHAISTTDLVAAPDSWLADGAPLLLVSFARSGDSPESVAAMALAEQVSPECHHLVLTCNREGALYRRASSSHDAHVVLMPEEANDRGFAMTSSFTTMMLGAAIMFSLVPPQSPATLGRWARDVLTGFPAHEYLTSPGFERVVYLGSNELKGLAREAALKMLELTDGKVVAVAETPLGFRHGPKTFISTKTLVVAFLSNNAYTRAYEVDLLNEIRTDGIAARVVALTAEHSASPSSPGEICVAGAATATDLELCFPFAVFAQSLAVRQSLSLGLWPDTPNASGVVNRVVHGVSVYRWNRRS